MKIKFLKDYRAFQDFEGSFEASNIYEVGEIKNVTSESARWLIDNGFAEEVKEAGWWRPKYCEKYFYIGHDGSVYSSAWAESEIDNGRLKLGSVFKTEEAAMRCRDYLQAVATVRQDEGVMTPEEVIHAADAGIIIGRIIVRDRARNLEASICNFSSAYPCVGTIYFDTCEHARASLDNHPDEWKIIANYDWSRE